MARLGRARCLNRRKNCWRNWCFDTTSRYSNLQLIEWARDYLLRLGVEATLTFNDDGGKANLFARIGAPELPVVLLSGHSDVVPVDGQVWDSDPFALTDKGDGRLYGRGSADMKGFIACVLSLAPWFVELAQGGKLRQAIGIALSYDEEVGCLGVGRMIDRLVADGVQVSGCIVGEPTSMQPVIAHKGIAHYLCKVSGRAAHSSLTPQGVNAIEFAARLITHIRKLADAEASFGHRQSLYDVPFTTLQTGTISGGTACNIVPKDCEFMFECRWLPGDSPERFVDSVRITPPPCCWKCAKWRRRRTSRSSLWCTARLSNRRKTARYVVSWRACAAATAARASPTPPRPGCSARPASPAWCWVRATSSRRIDPMNTLK